MNTVNSNQYTIILKQSKKTCFLTANSETLFERILFHEKLGFTLTRCYKTFNAFVAVKDRMEEATPCWKNSY